MLANAFKNLASVTFTSDYSFKQADKLKEAAKNTRVVAAAAPSGGAGKKEEPKEEKKEEEAADVDMGGLFGEEYWGRLFSLEIYPIPFLFR